MEDCVGLGRYCCILYPGHRKWLTIIIIVKRGEEKGFRQVRYLTHSLSAWALAPSKALSDLDAVLKRCAQASMLHNQVIIQLHLQSITTPHLAFLHVTHKIFEFLLRVAEPIPALFPPF